MSMSPIVTSSMIALSPDGPLAVLEAPPGAMVKSALPRSTSVMLIAPRALIDALE